MKEYKIVSCLSNKVLAVENENPNPGGKVIQYDWWGTQKWRFMQQDDGSYAIISLNGNVCLQCKAEKDQCLTTDKWYDRFTQKWILTEIDSEKNIYKISSHVESKLVFDVYARSTENGALIVLFFDQGTSNQMWQIEPV